jgi:hypothetical protein
MEDSTEIRLRALMRGEHVDDGVEINDARLERVLHKAHLQGGILDLLSLFARWGWVVSEGGARGLRHARPARREKQTEAPRSDSKTH